VSPEYDGNVPLTDYADWSANPQQSADGDVLFLASVNVRPLANGLTIGDTLSYRQQFILSNYNLLLNSTWIGYSYLGASDRLRATATFSYAMLGGSSLYVDLDGKFSYRRRLLSKLGLMFTYDVHYRDFQNPDYLAQSGLFQSLQGELGWGLFPQPVSLGIGYQAIREQTRTPDPTDPPGDDYRAWAHGPFLWLRARLHRRVELGLRTIFLQRVFDYVPGPELPQEQGIQRVDYALYNDLSVNITLKQWLEFFVSGTLIWNDSNWPAFLYLKPSTSLGLAGTFGLL
jgi:hypothetical protein